MSKRSAVLFLYEDIDIQNVDPDVGCAAGSLQLPQEVVEYVRLLSGQHGKSVDTVYMEP